MIECLSPYGITWSSADQQMPSHDNLMIVHWSADGISGGIPGIIPGIIPGSILGINGKSHDNHMIKHWSADGIPGGIPGIIPGIIPGSILGITGKSHDNHMIKHWSADGIPGGIPGIIPGIIPGSIPGILGFPSSSNWKPGPWKRSRNANNKIMKSPRFVSEFLEIFRNVYLDRETLFSIREISKLG